MKLKFVLLSLLVISIVLNVVLFIRQSAEEMLNHAIVISCEYVPKKGMTRLKCGGQTMLGDGFEFVFSIPDLETVPMDSVRPDYKIV